jgi:hypothetical protein
VYGLFTRFYDLEGKEEFNRLSEREKRTQTTLPALVSSHFPADSAKSSQVNTLPKAKSQAKDKRAKDRQ